MTVAIVIMLDVGLRQISPIMSYAGVFHGRIIISDVVDNK